jgi:hypothetical protein
VYVQRPSRVPGAVVWSRTVPADGSLAPVLPDGCVDLLWADGHLMIAGPDTAAHIAAAPPGAVFAGVRFAPGTGPTIIGVPGDEIRDRRVPLDAIVTPAAYRRAMNAVAPAAHSPAGRPALEAALESVAVEWSRRALRSEHADQAAESPPGIGASPGTSPTGSGAKSSTLLPSGSAIIA